MSSQRSRFYILSPRSSDLRRLQGNSIQGAFNARERPVSLYSKIKDKLGSILSAGKSLWSVFYPQATTPSRDEARIASLPDGYTPLRPASEEQLRYSPDHSIEGAPDRHEGANIQCDPRDHKGHQGPCVPPRPNLVDKAIGCPTPSLLQGAEKRKCTDLPLQDSKRLCANQSKPPKSHNPLQDKFRSMPRIPKHDRNMCKAATMEFNVNKDPFVEARSLVNRSESQAPGNAITERTPAVVRTDETAVVDAENPKIVDEVLQAKQNPNFGKAMEVEEQPSDGGAAKAAIPQKTTSKLSFFLPNDEFQDVGPESPGILSSPETTPEKQSVSRGDIVEPISPVFGGKAEVAGPKPSAFPAPAQQDEAKERPDLSDSVIIETSQKAPEFEAKPAIEQVPEVVKGPYATEKSVKEPPSSEDKPKLSPPLAKEAPLTEPKLETYNFNFDSQPASTHALPAVNPVQTPPKPPSSFDIPKVPVTGAPTNPVPAVSAPPPAQSYNPFLNTSASSISPAPAPFKFGSGAASTAPPTQPSTIGNPFINPSSAPPLHPPAVIAPPVFQFGAQPQYNQAPAVVTFPQSRPNDESMEIETKPNDYNSQPYSRPFTQAPPTTSPFTGSYNQAPNVQSYYPPQSYTSAASHNSYSYQPPPQPVFTQSPFTNTPFTQPSQPTHQPPASSGPPGQDGGFSIGQFNAPDRKYFRAARRQRN